MSCHSHAHGDDHLPPPSASLPNLYSVIDLNNVRVLNSEDPETAAAIIRPNDKRFEETPVLKSDADEELLLTVRFTGLVRLNSIFFRTLGDDTSPRVIKLYKNNTRLDFGNVGSAQCSQTLEYPANVGVGIASSDGSDGFVQFALNRAKFSGVSSLTIHITENYGADQTNLLYLGFKGEFSELKSAPVVAQYEAAANPKDHKVETHNVNVNQQLGN